MGLIITKHSPLDKIVNVCFQFLGSRCVRLNGLMVPSHKFRGQDSTLSCLYDMEGEQLYSVKWYKDDHEFFRFIPADRDQKITIFRLPGVKVDVSILWSLEIQFPCHTGSGILGS